MSQDVDRRETIFSHDFGGVGRKKNVCEQGSVRMIAAKEATRGDFSTSLSASSSNTNQESDESIFSDAQDDEDDGVCFR